MFYIDFHTHKVPAEKEVVAIVEGRETWGIHPWRADEEFVVPDLSGKLAIGECGLDGLRGPSMERQEEVFIQQIKLSEEVEKPLIIHCVKALDRLLQLHKELKPKQMWMLHGFRGKPQQLRSLLDAGFFVSFGFAFNEESLRICPIDRLLLETDADEERSIEELYNNVANLRGINSTNLLEAMTKNYLSLFKKSLI